MADVATPSAVTMSTGTSTPPSNKDNKKNVVDKPERPDQAKYDGELAEAEKKLQAAVEHQVNSVLLYLPL